ncbi:hypothetical protein M9434_004221 [Picochlorum sp. BPE23]|nr:hypothetical protein M9434_004221 [Picochlorum sp. BPE23]
MTSKMNGHEKLHGDDSMDLRDDGGLLMRFFESEFFDAWIAVSYLHKDLPTATREYLCRRMYSLPECEVESYVSQLCQLCVSKGGDPEVENLLVDLSSNSLNIAVKIYWILLAISQDRPGDEGLAKLRDRCELAGLAGHWQLPFKDAALPAPLPRRMNRFMRYSQNGQPSVHSSVELLGGSPDPLMERRHSLETGGRDASPDGLGTGLFSSVFVDTGVEGLLYDEPGPLIGEVHERQQQRVSVSGSGVSQGSDRSKMYESIDSLNSDGSTVTFVKSSLTSPSTLVDVPSPPSSPKRRETTFGATLDFVEALCCASSFLTSFSEGERQWALHKSLKNINAEIEKASSTGVAIWFPMRRAAPQRVVRLAYRESRLLNSREKAPFTLYVEVLNEDTSVLEAEGILSPGTSVAKSRTVSGDISLGELDNLSKSLEHELSGYHMKAAAREAAAAGIAWMPQHHRKNSSHDFSASNLASIALAAVNGSSAAENAYDPPVNQSDSLQLTPSVTSQKSDASLLATELSLADFVDSGEGSPVSHVSKQSYGDEEAGKQKSVQLPRPPVQGGGTWLGGLSDTCNGRKDVPGQKSISSPRIKATIDEIRGESSLVALSIVVNPRQIASSNGSKCTNSGLLCKVGICQCPKVNETKQSDKAVQVSIKLRQGLDLTVKPQKNRHRRMPSREALLQVAKQHKLPPPALPSTIESSAEYEDMDREIAKYKEEACEVYGEKWEDRRDRIRKKSPHGNRPGWDLRSVIVKSGDDCRQELLSMQLIRTFHSIFLEADLPLWLRPYEVLVTSNLTALIEMIPNAPSIHHVKSSFSNQRMSLRDHFVAKFGSNTREFEQAQNNFVESMAAYSLVCHLLQIRDRHNGNLLLDDSGHIIHIDFGFMLSNSPGGVNFESAPFKLTRELLEIMDSDSEGKSSKAFDYFKILMIQGFIAIRKHSDRLLELVSMMSDSGCPCFKNKVLAVEGLRKRLAPGLSEEALVKHVLNLIGDSLDAWRTRQYDYYQRVLNGIM